MLDSLVRVTRRVGWGADIAADPGRLVRREQRSPSPAARRGRGALRTVRPGFGESSRAGGGAARPPGTRAGRLVRREQRSPSPAARRGRGALRTVRPGFGESSRAGGGAARPPGTRARTGAPAPTREGRRRAAEGPGGGKRGGGHLPRPRDAARATAGGL